MGSVSKDSNFLEYKNDILNSCCYTSNDILLVLFHKTLLDLKRYNDFIKLRKKKSTPVYQETSFTLPTVDV